MRLYERFGEEREFIEIEKKSLEILGRDDRGWTGPFMLRVRDDRLEIHYVETRHSYYVVPDDLPE